MMRTLGVAYAHVAHHVGAARALWWSEHGKAEKMRDRSENQKVNEKVRLNLQVSQELNQLLEEIADTSGTNRTDVIRQALALMKVAHNAKKDGRHVGIVSDANKLDTEIIGLL
jgi:regulator of PEP synthase PpsR (kinase-PPPase family)